MIVIMSSTAFHEFKANGQPFLVPTRYSLIRPIGHGAYGVVISAQDSVSGKKVAIKKIRRAFDDKVDANRLRERALTKLKMNGGGSQKDRDKSHPSQQPTFFRSSFFIISIVALRGLWYLVMGGSSHHTKRDN